MPERRHGRCTSTAAEAFLAALPKALVSAVALALLTFGSVTEAQDPRLTGSWQGFGQGVTFDLVVGADGSYRQQAVSGSRVTVQQGHYDVLVPGVLSFVVEKWQPERLPKPPGGTFRILFTSPDCFLMKDIHFQGVAVFYRVP